MTWEAQYMRYAQFYNHASVQLVRAGPGNISEVNLNFQIECGLSAKFSIGWAQTKTPYTSVVSLSSRDLRLKLIFQSLLG